jgi:isoleucyl-tRNA synthetase
MGTALNKVLKDLIVKSKSMAGFRAPFVPGWDCHGLPIEFKVVKESKGLSPAEVRRRSTEYALKYVEIQRSQFKRLGVFGDWDRPYLTLDPSYEADILRAFAGFVEKGLVYQSKKPVFWSIGAQTALAEAEVEYADREDPAIFVEFPFAAGPLAGRASMVIWTTTPWTLPANVAVAVHPREVYILRRVLLSGRERCVLVAEKLWNAFEAATGAESVPGNAPFEQTHWFGSDLSGSQLRHPFLPRNSVVIHADFVTTETGTGQVHIAPGHGADDYLAGIQNGLPVLSPVDDHGRFTSEVGIGDWEGRNVFDANADVIALLREKDVLLGEQVYRHSYPHCWRSKTPIVFRAVEQLFIRVDAIRAEALRAIDKVRWIPAWGRNRIGGTVESRPDWCISRQRSWGVPLPVFYSADGALILEADLAREVASVVENEGTNAWFERGDDWWCERLRLPAGTTRRNDTLDVWIDSGVSHEAVLRRRSELSFPADVYVEATDQHRGWFQSSLMTGVALRSCAPFRAVITHGFVVDKDTRKKVSKSAQGSYVKPMEAEHFVGKYGADIVRLWASSVEYTHEVPFSEEAFSVLTDAYRQFRNVLRILLANLHDFSKSDASLNGATTVDLWMLSRMQEVTRVCREAYAAYDFRRVFQTLNQFCTVDLSSLYVDITKDRLYCDAVNAPRRRATQTVMLRVFEGVCRLLAPILAFTADEAWNYLHPEGSVHLEVFPEADLSAVNPVAEERFEKWLQLRSVVSQALEPARQHKIIGNALEATVEVEVSDEVLWSGIEGWEMEVEEALILSSVRFRRGNSTTAQVEKNGDSRCARCWRHKPSVGRSALHSDLCERCENVIVGGN